MITINNSNKHFSINIKKHKNVFFLCIFKKKKKTSSLRFLSSPTSRTDELAYLPSPEVSSATFIGKKHVENQGKMKTVRKPKKLG